MTGTDIQTPLEGVCFRGLHPKCCMVGDEPRMIAQSAKSRSPQGTQKREERKKRRTAILQTRLDGFSVIGNGSAALSAGCRRSSSDTKDELFRRGSQPLYL